MKASLAASMLAVHLAASAAAPASTPTGAPLLPRLTEDAIRQAVREVLDESPKANGLPHETAVLRGDKYENFSRQFSEIMRFVATALLGFSCCAATGAQPVPARASAVGPMFARPSDESIQKAVREVLDENPENPRRHEADTIRGNRYQEFADQFSEAKVPDCLHADALKRQPPRIGPVAFKGLYAAPFVVLAKVRGKCI